MLITHEDSRPTKNLREQLLEEENKLLKGNLQLHRLYSIVLMFVVFILAIGLFAVTYNNGL